ncbi:DUF6309 family protein [Nocardiopsis trehalosi]|uniref:DUF6309 family protein n=1 Tax=Nocardiopsis trehalosi TaxID=109329 RepID=UPI00082E7475|nr:DUF6309 family protein [Nocardiopsis trehalosi]
MHIAGPVAFSEVRRAYLRDHPAERDHPANTNRDGADNLDRAEELLGTWFRVRLRRAEVLAVMLPWHLSEGGGYELVPPSGLTVGQAAERLRTGGAAVAAANPVCSAKLDLMGRAPLTPVYLSVGCVEHVDYAGLRVRDTLTHLDGLHRMLAWELAGRLPAGGLDAYVAGDPRTLPPDRAPGAAAPRSRTGGPTA